MPIVPLVVKTVCQNHIILSWRPASSVVIRSIHHLTRLALESSGGVACMLLMRAGMSMLLAALCADGQSMIGAVYQIDKGYERIDERLRALGARIERVPV